MDDDLKEALEIIQEALLEHEQTWGKESYGDNDWSVRAGRLLSKHEGKH